MRRREARGERQEARGKRCEAKRLHVEVGRIVAARRSVRGDARCDAPHFAPIRVFADAFAYSLTHSFIR